MKIYCEQKDYESFEYLYHSFINFIKRNQLFAENQKQTYLNFISLTNKILKAKNSNSGALNLKNEILNTSPVANSSWLLREIDKQL